MTRARWLERGDMADIAAWAPAAIRYATEDLHDVTTSVATEIPETATRVFVFYKINTGYTRSDTSQLRPGLDARFDVQINQALPFELGGTRWEVLLGLAQSVPGSQRSGVRLRRVARRPATQAGGRRVPRSFLSAERVRGARHVAALPAHCHVTARSACQAGLDETRLFLPVFCVHGFLDRLSG